MEERRMAGSEARRGSLIKWGKRGVGLCSRGVALRSFIFCFVIGMLVGQSTGKQSAEWTKCYDGCTRLCFYSLNANVRGLLGCMNCDSYCRREINGEACFFFWCRKVKNRGWLFFSLLVLVTTKNTIRDRAGNKN